MAMAARAGGEAPALSVVVEQDEGSPGGDSPPSGGESAFAKYQHQFLAWKKSIECSGCTEEENTRIGLAFYAANSLLVSIVGVLGKLLEEQTITPFQIGLLRSLFSVAVASAVAYREGGVESVFALAGHNKKMLVVRGVMGTGAFLCLMLAVHLLPIGDAVSITFLMPVFVAVLGQLVLKEPVSGWVWVALPFCLAGVVMVARPSFLFRSSEPLSSLGVMVAVAQAGFSAGGKITIRKLAGTESAGSLVLYMGVIGALTSGLGCAATWRKLGRLRAQDMALFVGLCLCGYTGQLALVAALKRAKAAAATSMGYLQAVWSMVGGVLVFGEIPTGIGIAGMTSIVLGCVIQASGPGAPIGYSKVSGAQGGAGGEGSSPEPDGPAATMKMGATAVGTGASLVRGGSLEMRDGPLSARREAGSLGGSLEHITRSRSGLSRELSRPTPL